MFFKSTAIFILFSTLANNCGLYIRCVIGHFVPRNFVIVAKRYAIVLVKCYIVIKK